MFLRSITVENFRNIKHTELEFNSRFVLIQGGNGQGKTSLIEAIYLLSSLRSFRAKKIAEIAPILLGRGSAQQDLSPISSGGPTKVVASIEADGLDKELSYEIDDGKRTSHLNAEKISAVSELYGNLATVYFIPEDLQIIKGGPEGRRLLMDQAISSVDRLYVQKTIDYLRALKNRNALLVELSKRTHLHGYPQHLEPWDEILVSAGSYIATARRQFISASLPRFKQLYSVLSAGSEEYEIIYKSDFGGEDDSSQLSQSYVANLQRDLKYKYTSFGVQRDDLSIKVRGRDDESYSAKHYASQGQSRSMALALKLAAADFISERIGESPVIMLDDVESELDAVRRKNLMQLVYERASQVFITTAVPELSVNELPGDVERFGVRGGEFKRI